MVRQSCSLLYHASERQGIHKLLYNMILSHWNYKYQLRPILILTIWQVMVEPFKHFHNACRQYVYRDVVNKGCELNQHFESGRLYRHIRESPLLS